MTLSAAELEIMQKRLYVIAQHLFEMQSNNNTLEYHNIYNAINAAHSCSELALAAIKTEAQSRGLEVIGDLRNIEGL